MYQVLNYDDIVMPFISNLIKTIKNLARRVFVAEKNMQKMQEILQSLQEQHTEKTELGQKQRNCQYEIGT